LVSREFQTTWRRYPEGLSAYCLQCAANPLTCFSYTRRNCAGQSKPKSFESFWCA